MTVTARALDESFPDLGPWTLAEAMAGGSQGAVLATSDSGARYVAKLHASAERTHFDAVKVRGEKARAAGLPAPSMAVEAGAAGVVLLLEHLPGTAGAPPTSEVAEQLLTLNRRLRGLGSGPAGDWQALMRRSLTEGLEGYCEHASLANFSDDSRRLLSKVVAAAADVDWSSLPADDLVHYDFHPGNILVSTGKVSGIVDWDGCRSGDGLLDLVALAFCSTWTAEEQVLERLWAEVFADGDRQRRSVAVHHIVLRLADWCIRYSPAEHAHLVVANGHGAVRSLAADHWLGAVRSLRRVPPDASTRFLTE
jgi:hypothetical protein